MCIPISKALFPVKPSWQRGCCVREPLARRIFRTDVRLLSEKAHRRMQPWGCCFEGEHSTWKASVRGPVAVWFRLSKHQYRWDFLLLRWPCVLIYHTCTVAAHMGSAFAGARWVSVAARCLACMLFRAGKKRSCVWCACCAYATRASVRGACRQISGKFVKSRRCSAAAVS